jgi:hypothetical protein
MPNTIIADWLNLPSVRFDKAITHGDCTERDYSSGFTCSTGCLKRVLQNTQVGTQHYSSSPAPKGNSLAYRFF